MYHGHVQSIQSRYAFRHTYMFYQHAYIIFYCKHILRRRYAIRHTYMFYQLVYQHVLQSITSPQHAYIIFYCKILCTRDNKKVRHSAYLYVLLACIAVYHVPSFFFSYRLQRLVCYQAQQLFEGQGEEGVGDRERGEQRVRKIHLPTRQ